jgi:hypothetical protein
MVNAIQRLFTGTSVDGLGNLRFLLRAVIA